MWQVFIHVNCSKNIPTKRTDSGLIQVYNFESEGPVKTEDIRREVTENSPETIKHRSCVHQKECRLVLGVTSKNIVGRSETKMIDLVGFGFIKSCKNWTVHWNLLQDELLTNRTIHYKSVTTPGSMRLCSIIEQGDSQTV